MPNNSSPYIKITDDIFAEILGLMVGIIQTF